MVARKSKPHAGRFKPGHLKIGGRKPGTPNKATADVRALAQEHGPAAIAELARLALEAESEAARVAAIRELLDRGYGRSPQPLVGADGETAPSSITVTWLAPEQ